MAFLRQLKLLLWKNGLAVVRQPLWSLTLIIWPVIIFMIIAVTRKQFPPVIKETCFVGPRNLPSAGFFPFLQTLMCNTDSNCNNKSLSVDPAALKSTNRRGTRLNQLLQPADLNFNVSKNYRKDSDALIEALSSILGPFHQQGFNNVSHMNPMNTTLLGDQESLNKLLESMNMLKRAICTMTLSTMNTTSHNPLSYAVVTFCRSNNTVFEVSLNTLNQLLTELMVTKPNETMTVAAAAVMVFDKLQNHTSLWESLLAIPQLLSSGSFDQVLASAEVLLTNVQSAMNVIQSNFPEVSASLSTVHPFLAGGINMIRYAQKWPGRGVSITLGDIVTLQNDSLSEMVKRVLQEVKIPLDKAIGLTFDRDMVLSHLCENSSNPLWLTAACSTGTVNTLLGFISPDKVAKQILLVWSERVAPHDVSFAKGLLHSLMGGPSPGGQGGTRNRRSVETQPQNIEEELFLGVGKVVMEIIQTVPELDMVVDAFLKTGFQFMQSATLGLDTVEEMMENFLKDANQIQMTYLSLMTNQSAASVCISHILDGVMGILPKVMSTQSLTCEGLLGPFEWLLNTESIKIEVWRSAICQNSSALQEALLMDWLPLIQKGQDLYIALTGQGNYNLTLPMILSEWHKLYNKSMQFGMRSNRLAAELSGEYWINWMVDNSTQDVPGILQQSVFLFMVNVGENIEKSQLWPEVKDYFHMLYWILNYRPDVTTQPANCSIDINYLSIHCNTGLKWPQFVQAMTQALLSPSQDALVNCLKGTVNLLQHAYGDVYRNLVGTYLKQEIQGGDALSAYLINLMKNLDGFVNTITMLPDQSIANPNVTIPLIGNLLQSTGLRPLLPLLLSDSPLNASALLDVASKLGRLNQHIFTFNETDPTMPELERLIMLFLSLEGNLTMSLSHIMGNTELTYSDYFHPDYVARLRQAIEPFTNQTSAGFVETILSAMELLKKMLDAPNGDPTNIILEYTRQLQEFLKSLYRLQKIQHQGQLSPAQVTDLHSLSKDFLDLLTQEGLQNLTQAGPDAAQNIVAQKLVAFLPPEVRQEAARFFQDFKALQYQIAKCAAGQNCLAGISEIFTFLDQISELMLSANGNVTITLAATNLVLEGREYEEITSLFFPLLLSSNDASYVETFKQTLHFIRLIMATPNITVSDVQNALQQSNLTLGELNNIAALAGAANINDLIGNIMQIIDARQCFEPQHNPMVTTQCVMGLISGVSSFLTHLPAFRNETAILSLIPLIINNTISDGVQVDFSSNPNLALAHILNRTLANIKMSFQLNHMYTPEIMKEIRVVEGLIRLVANTDPFDNLNTSLLMNSGYAQKIYLEIVEWYLKRLENITSTSSASELLAPFYHFTQMQVTSQLAYSEFSLFISKQVESLINSLQYPIDGAGVRQIGLTTVEILRRQFDLIILEVEAQNNFPGSPPLHNTTALHVIKLQVKLYLDTIEMWMKQPNVLPVLSSLLQWGNPSINVSTPVTDIQHLLGTMVNVLSADQQAYLSIISNITKSLNEALMVAEQPGGPQSDHFLAAILEAVQKAMQVVTAATGPLPLSVQQNILEIVGDSVKLAVHPDISFASSRNISLLILKRVESVIQQTLPEIAEYLLPALKVATTYFQSVSAGGGPNVWNQLILDEMNAIQSLLPLNSSAQAYVSVLINITHFILESGQGNMSLWAMFESASVENLPMIFGQSVHFLATIIQSAIQTLTGATGPLPPSVQQDILEIVQDSLSLIQPDMSFASSRNISLLILKRAESIIKQTLPEIAEYLLPALKVATQYFNSISAASGPNIWNQLILDEMKTIQSLLPPNSSAQAYVSVLINITHFILESGQGNMSLWAMFESASVENLPMIFGQSVHFLPAIVQSAIQTLTGATGPLPLSVQQDILEILQDSLKLFQPDMSFASSRNISLLILKRAESIIKQTLPEIAEYLLPALKVATQYFNSISAASGPNIWNQLILGEMKTIQSLLPPNSSAQAYVSVLINITHFILESGQGNMSLWAMFENASVENLPMIFGQSVHFLAAIVQSAIQTLTGATGPLPPSVQQDILEIVQDSLKLIQPEMSFASSRNISLLILKRAENIIKQTLPEIAEYLLPALKVATQYFESISAASGPNIWNQLILDEMKTIQSLLPPNSSAQAYVCTLINITHFILESGQGNMSLWAMFENASVENLPMIFGQSVHFLSAIVQSAIQTLTGATGPLPLSVQQDIMEIVQDSLKLIQPDIGFASSRNISLLILKRAESIIKQTLPEIAEYLLPALEVATQYFESISAASGPNIWNQLILDEMKTIQSLLPPNSSAQAYVCTLINITHFILESGQGNMSLWAMFENASVENLPMIFGQSVHFLPAIVQSAIQTLTGATAPLPPSVQQDILEIVQDSLKLIQPNMSFASSRNISLLILKRAESIIKQTLPEIAEYLLPALEVATQYFESISAASGPNIWNQLILDEMKTIQSLLPPNSSAQAYVCTLINITHFILESGQGNMSLWAMFENASVENLPMIFGQSVHFLSAIVQSAIQTLTGATGPLPPSVQQDILEIVQDSLKLFQPDMSFASSRNISLFIFKRAESIIKQTLPEIAEYLLPALEVATQYFESISAASGPNIWNQLILNEMKTIQSLLPPNSSAQAYVCTLINITHFILESGQGNMSLWAMFENASVENLPMIFGQSVHFLAAIIQSAIQTLTGATGPLPLSVQQDIMEILQDSLKLIQPDIGFASSRNISLLILKRAESIIKQTLPEIAEYLLPALEVATQYFESISAASGPNIWNQLILGEMKTIQSLLPPNSSAQAYVCTLINITHFILESGQGNMSLWAMFENASVENLPMIFGQSVHFLPAIVQSAIQTLTGATGPLPPSVQQDILEIVQDSLKLIQPNMSFASSRNISLLILKRAESIIKQTLPEIAEYLLPALEVATQYFESISAASGPNIWNQLILGEMKTIQSLLPPNSSAQAYVSVLINITHFILESGQGNMSLWAMFENASVENLPMIFGQSVHFLPAIVQSAIQTLTGATVPLPPSVQQDILEIVQDSLKLIQPNMSFASSRNISLLILKRAESIIKQTLPEIAEYLLPALEVATQYFESISAASGPNIWNQLILDEMKTIQSLLPPNSSAQAYVCTLINITHFILESGQGNMSLWAMFENASVENLPMIFGQSVHFLSAIVQSAIQTLTGATGPLPLSVQQDIMEIVQDSLKLIQPDMSFASSRNISLFIFKRAESIIKQTLPEIAEYLLPALEVATQYFESISAASGPNIWNQLILDEMKTIQSLLPPNSSAQAYVCTLINITHFILESGQGNMSLWAMFENASVKNLPMIFGQNVHFLAAIVQSAIQTLTGATGPLPLSVQQDIMEIVQDSLKLIQPGISFASSRNISLLILMRAESIIKQTLPEIAEYLLPALEIPTMYFESISAASGPNIWYQLILGEMTADQSLLPPNSPAQAFVSVLINITHFILESGQGNMSLWAGSESSSENLPMIFDQIGKLLSSLWALIMGDPGSPVSPPSLGVFAHLAPVLEQLLTGKANQQTWDKLEKILEALLSTLKGTEPWDPSVIPLLEKIIGSTVNNIQGQNALILSLQTPLLTLIGEITQTVNGSHFNLSDVSEEMQHAIERTLKAAEQANGTLGCGEVLKAWEPVREASGLSQATVYMWCNISLQPVLKAYAASQAVYTHMNMSQMGGGPMNVSATSAGIVKAVQSFYQANINSSLVTERVISAILSQLSQLAGRPLSHEAQLYLYKQLQDMQLQNSLSSFKMLTDELVSVAPFIQPYVEAVERALRHILGNYHLLQNSSSSQDLFREAAMIFLSAANITADDIFPMMWGDLSGPNAASLTDMLRQAVRLVIDMEIFGDAPMVYRTLEQFLASNDSSVIAQKLTAMCAWLTSTQASGLDLLTQALPKIYDILRPLLSVLTQMGMDTPANTEPFEDLAGNILAMLRQLVSTSGLMTPMSYHPSMYQQHNGYGNHTGRVRNRRESPLMMMAREPMDDFIDLFQIDYPAMFRAISVPVTTAEITETVQMVFANPDLSVVIKGSTRGIPGDSSAFREKTIDAGLGLLSFFTLPAAVQMSSMDLLANAANVLPTGFPFSSVLKNITRALAGESQRNLMLMAETFQKAAELFQISPMDPRFAEQLGHLRSKVCTLEKTQSVRQLMLALSIEPGQLCHTVLPSLQILTESLTMNTTALTDAIFQAFIGDPQTYNVQSNWSSVLTRGLGFNTSSLSSFNINITSPGAVTVGEMLRNKAAFVEDVQKHMNFDTAALHLLMETTLPNNNLEILSWLINLRHCSSAAALNMEETDVVILNTFCSLSVGQWYSFSLLMARHLNMEKLIYRMVLSEELQSLVRVTLQMAEVLTNMMDTILPAVGQLQTLMLSMNDIDLMADPEFRDMVRGQRETLSSQATFVTLSRALCSKGIVALLGISKLPATPESNSFSDPRQREEMIERFKIPQDATPFCMNMYLDMVNTTGGAIAWAFLKPMLMGNILFTPDTPTTRAIMEKANGTLKEFGNLRKYSEDWLESSNYIMKSAGILGHTLPMLQNSLGNSFVVNFIEMQTDINVGRMKETLSNFSNMTVLLEKNKHIMKQITTLSTLMVNISSCIKFDRYRGFDSANELDTVAQDLAKNRDLYASVIFKLPKDEGSSRKRQARSSSSTSPLPPKVRYTIRMHMDNVMRTDRVRNPYYVKDNHISARLTLRYNRGFIYLQENIDRAIIETQTGQRVADPAVQLQPFPYPCFYRDEYLEAISFVFPVMLMLAWVLFVADFVKKLVYERELRLHEYMKMMGVNPLSHFFAWFLECATYLVLTIFLLTLVLKFGSILPNSDGFLLFLYLCDYGLSILSFSYLVSSFFDKTYIAGLSGSLLYILCFFPFIVVLAMETKLTFFQKSALSLFSPTCFSYASQYISRYEAQGEGILWSNSYTSPIAGDMASFGWLCWLMLIDSILYFIIGAYIRMVFPGKYGIPAPWYFPFKASFWADLCCCIKSNSNVGRGLLFTNIMQTNQPVFSDDKGKGKSTLTSQAGEDFSELPVGVALHGLSKSYGDQVAIENLNVSFYEGHVTSLLGHNGAGKTTTMSLLTGLFSPSSGTIEVYGRDMQTNIDDVRRELGVCMQYDVLFEHMTTKEHLLLYGQIKAPQWSPKELHEQVRTILEETGMYAHRHKRVGTLSGGMKRKLSISIAFIGGSRLVVLDEPTTGVDPCSRRNIWDIVIQYKKHRTIIMSTHHLDEAEVLSDRIAFLERGGLKCCGSPFYLKDKLGQGYKLTLTKKLQNLESERIDNAELKDFIQAHVPAARLKEAHGGDLIYSLPPFTSSNASSYRSLLTALDSNLDALQLGGYGISDTTLEEVFLQLTHGDTEIEDEVGPLSISEMVSDTDSMDSFPSVSSGSISDFGDNIKLNGSSMVRGMALAWQQMSAILIKRFHHSRRDWKGLISQILLPVLFMVFAMGLGAIRSDLRHYPEMELSPALYNLGPSFSFFSNQNPNSAPLTDSMMSFPGIDNACLDKSDNPVCRGSTNKWSSSGNSSKAFSVCKCTSQEQMCDGHSFQPPHKKIPSSQTVYNLSGINVEKYLVATANDFIRNRYGGFTFGMPLPHDLKMDLRAVPKNRTLSKVWFNPEGQHTMPAYLNSLSNIILRSNLPADKDPRKYAISVSSHPYFGRPDDEDSIVQGMLQILLAMCVLTGYSITTASFAIYEVNEHHSGSKRLQHISGISEPFYWAVNFFYDMVMYLIPVTLTVGVIAAFQIPAFTDRQNLAAVALLLVLFGFATFPWMYLLSGVFKDAEMAFITYVCINLFISINTIMSTSILFFLSQISFGNSQVIQDLFNSLSNAFLIFPQFNFGNGLMKLARMNIEVQLLSGYGIDTYKNPFSTDALGWMFISSFIQGVVFFTLRLLLNRFIIRKVRNLICGRKMVPQVACEDEDEDVAAENLRVSSGAASTDILQVNQLTKVYQHLRKKVPAVKSLSVGIPAGECFGLLGVNGAGKTTTFKMLTGDVSPTDGTAQIRDWDGRLVDIIECRNKGINIGYCPQVDALDNLLTGKEHLYFYARIRGISKREIDGVVNYLLKRLELAYHRDIITDGYSCGTRRKLSTALALIGHPQILLLDEPSSGMDPRTKRHLWKIISEEVKGKCAVVLTSHSMEECEALCSRLAIMVKGQFRCLGSLQHIKNRFGSGFTVKMYLAEASCDVEAITGFMRGRFPSTYLKDQHSAMVEYHVPIAPGGVADIFDQLESNKNALQIKHFSVSQTTLDEVFINFAMEKIAMETVPLRSEDEYDDLDSIKTVET